MGDSDYDRWKRGEDLKARDAPVDALQSIDRSLKTIKRIAIWFLILSIISLVVGIMAAAGAFR
jgi:hypothetical protein